MDKKIIRLYMPKLKNAIILLFIFFITISLIIGFRKVLDIFTENGISYETLTSLATNQDLKLKKSAGVTNILILGIGGAGHVGGDLTDTMMILSIRPLKNSLLLSIPRDLWSPDLQDKINTAYHYGEEKKPGGGLIFAKVSVSDLLGIPIHYALVLDFQVFKNIIDILKGINVEVSQGFTDTEYPIAGKENDYCEGDPFYKCRYQTVTFNKGIEFMSGERALIYVRSRHASGDTGTDFDRSRRQQEVIVALKKRLLNIDQIFKYAENMQLYKTIWKSIISDINIVEMLAIGKHLIVSSGRMQKLSLERLLAVGDADKYNNRYVLVPKDSDTFLEKIQNMIK